MATLRGSTILRGAYGGNVRRRFERRAIVGAGAGGRVDDLAGTAVFLMSGEVIAAAPSVFSALREVIAAGR